MAAQALIYVLETVFNLFVLAVLTRFYAQALRAPFRNPIANFVVALTDFAVKPMRKVIPGAMGLDLASLVAAWIAQTILLVAVCSILDVKTLGLPGFWPTIVLLAMVKLLKLSIYLLMGVVIIQAVLSWVSPYHPIRPFFDALSRPFLRPFQRLIPLVGGVDLSPLLLLVILQVILIAPMMWLEIATGRMLPGLFAGG
ncbi:MAG: YggT family protein [Betaproteobacteria bacterium]